MILLSDANVLIDMGYVDGLSLLSQLGQVEVLDVVFDECLHPRQPSLPTRIQSAGIQQIAVSREWVQSAQPYHQGPFSLQDALCFYYAKTFNRLLLTNEKLLRTLCQQERVSVHGTLWIVQQIYHRQILSSAELCQWLSILVQKGSRMPKPELTELRAYLNCP